MRAATVPSILQFPPHLIAYQLTLVESAIFLEIKARALLEHTPRHPNSQIVASTDFFNYLTRLIEHSILLPQEATTRAQHIHHWVKVAAKCHELQNYQTLKAIVSALGTPPVQRLKRTWACMPKKSMTRLEFLSELMSETRNYGRYREHMGMVNSSNVNGMSISVMKRETLKKPTVPFLGTFIHDITYLVAAVKSTSIHSVTSITSATTAVNRDSLNHSERPPSPTLSTVSTLTPENDPRVKDLLATMHYYQSGPKYALVPPSNYTKAAQKHHFRTPSLPSALHRSSGGKGRSSFGGGDEEEEGIETQQQLITHYLLTRAWVSEKIVDELSVLREPPKRPATSGTGSPNRGSGGGGSGAAGSGGSGSGHRPNSMEDGVDVPARTSALVGEDGGTGMVFVSTLDKAEREREGGKEKRGFLSLFSVRTSLEKERPALAEVPQGRRSMAKEEPVLADMVLPDSDDEDEIDSEEYVELDQRSKERRQSWKGTKFMADEEKGIK
ncbi:ras guanine nucleotide exchange factor domain-containing protein, partial [Jimgerdemannia flammicorona]